MSQLYSTEPSTSGRVILTTSDGPIDINLWCKECPAACRTFLQLCLDGYFDNLPFHRIMDKFLIQTGLRPNASSYLLEEEKNKRDALELNPRIRFNHRGQVAFARNADDSGDAGLGGQFFMTLDAAPWLDGKHAVFGTVVDPTIFNALRIGRTEVKPDTDVPIDDPPTVKGVKIEFHPFEDLVASLDVPWRVTSKGENDKNEGKRRKKKRKGKKDFNVLSFGTEEEEPEAQSSNSDKIKSSHDLIDTRTSKEVNKKQNGRVEDEIEASIGKSDDGDVTASVNTEPKSSEEERNTPNNITAASEDKIIAKADDRIQNTALPTDTNTDTTLPESLHSNNNLPESHIPPKALGENIALAPPAKVRSEVEARRAKYFKSNKAKMRARSGTRGSKKEENAESEDGLLARLSRFRSKVLNAKSASKDSKNTGMDNSLATQMSNRANNQNNNSDKFSAAEVYRGQVMEKDDDSDGNDQEWMRTKFKCRKHVDHSSRKGGGIEGGDGRNTNDYVVLDERSGKDAKAHKKRKTWKR